MREILYERDQVCPICGRTFPQTMVRSSLCAVEKRDTDFRVEYRNCDPNWYAIVVCPGCGYASPNSSFSSVCAGEQERLHSVLAELGPIDLTGKRSLTQAVESFERAIRCGQARKLTESTLGGLYLKTAWLYRQMGETEREHALLHQALAAYKEAFGHERDTQMSPSDLTYLIGELNRRTKHYEEAVVWFSKVAEDKDARPGTVRLAREMWQLAREAYRQGPAEHSIEEVYPHSVEDDIKEAAPSPSVDALALPKRSKVSISSQLYVDQVRWLEQVGRWWAGEPSLDAGSALRALVDLVSDLSPHMLQVASESELKKVLAEHIIARTGGGMRVKN